MCKFVDSIDMGEAPRGPYTPSAGCCTDHHDLLPQHVPQFHRKRHNEALAEDSESQLFIICTCLSHVMTHMM